ncbi:MAG: ankyrin repeat domain-containing protein [Promethearchaeota archaeon]
MAKKKVTKNIPEIQGDVDKVLIQAAYNDNFEMVKWALKMGADVNAQDSHGHTALTRLCDYKGTIEIAKYLIEHGAEVNFVKEYGHDPLGYAVMSGHLELAKLLLESGADINNKTEYGRTALHSAALPIDYEEKNKYELMKFLLDNGADPNIAHSGGDTPLLEALMYDDIDIEEVKLFIEYGVDLKAVGCYDATALSRAAESGRMDIVELIEQELCKNEEDLSIESIEKALLNTFNKDNKEMVFHLLEKAEGNLKKNFYRVNVLAYAARKNHRDIVQYLIEKNLIDPKKDDLDYGLEEAAYYGNLGVIKLIIDNGADVNGGDLDASENLLMTAARHDYHAIAKYILEKGANIEVRDYKGNTPLFFAAWEGKLEMVKFLVSKGADINATNDLNWNALMQACLQGHYSVAEFLIEKGSELNLIDEEKGATALILAAFACSEKIVKLLLEKGADKNIKDQNGETAADHARNQGCKKIAELIENY